MLQVFLAIPILASRLSYYKFPHFSTIATLGQVPNYVVSSAIDFIPLWSQTFLSKLWFQSTARCQYSTGVRR